MIFQKFIYKFFNADARRRIILDISRRFKAQTVGAKAQKKFLKPFCTGIPRAKNLCTRVEI